METTSPIRIRYTMTILFWKFYSHKIKSLTIKEKPYKELANRYKILNDDQVERSWIDMQSWFINFKCWPHSRLRSFL